MVYSKSGELRFDDLCMEGSRNDAVKLHKCAEGNQKQIWKYDNDVNSISILIFKSKKIFLLDKTNQTCLLCAMYDCRSE